MKASNIIVIVGLLLSACATKKDSQMSVQMLPTPAASPSAEPFLFTSPEGTVFLSWIEKREDNSEFKFSTLIDGAWSAPSLIDSGRAWFVNWADYPMITTNGANLLAAYLKKSGEATYAYDVNVTLSSDHGSTWTDAFVLHDDGKQAEHGFMSLMPYDDDFFVTWLDGRNTVMEGMEGMDHHEGHHGQMSLRAAVLDSSGSKINEWQLDNRTCDCCQTGAAITANGPVVVYRDRDRDEIRDMSIVRYVNGQWTDPRAIYRDNWKIAGCPVNGPRIVANGNTVVVAWYTAPEGNARVNVIFSKDGGATFGNPVRVDEGKTIGRVDLEFIGESTVFVTWMEGTTIKGAHVNESGKDHTITIAESSDARSSGFPQLARSGNTLVFAWTDDKEKSVKTAMIRIQ